MLFGLLFGLIVFIHSSSAFVAKKSVKWQHKDRNLSAPLSHCSVHTDCVSCTKDSFLGQTCRWCPVDNMCHDYGSLENHCDSSQNIVDPSKCNTPHQKPYDTALAWTNLVLSSAAYSDNPNTCFANALGNQFQVFGSPAKVSCDFEGNICFGYVAVSAKLGKIVLAFRGTISGNNSTQLLVEILKSITGATEPWKTGGLVAKYWFDGYNLLGPKLIPLVQKAVQANPSFEVWVTGHSLGAALASLAATELVATGVVKKGNLLQYTFGQPRVGDYNFAKGHDQLVLTSYRLIHHEDIVVHLPFCHETALICTACDGCSYHHGTEIFYNSTDMPTNAKYQECLGLPHNEDMGCSDGLLIAASINDHDHYFNKEVAAWGRAGCTSVRKFSQMFDVVGIR